jgi:hypothetical protein
VLGKMIEIRDDEDLPILNGMFPMN